MGPLSSQSCSFGNSQLPVLMFGILGSEVRGVIRADEWCFRWPFFPDLIVGRTFDVGSVVKGCFPPKAPSFAVGFPL